MVDVIVAESNRTHEVDRAISKLTNRKQTFWPLKEAVGALNRQTEKDTTMPRRSTPDAFALQVGNRIRDLRKEQGLSLAALADASALSKGHLSSVEHGLAAITIHTVARLAEGFGVPPLYLLTFAKEDERAHVAELVRQLSAADVKKLRRQLQAQIKKG